MTFAYVVFAHTKIDILQRVQNKFLSMASGCPWYVCSLTLHKDFELESLKEFCKRADSYSNPQLSKRVSTLLVHTCF